MLLMEVIMADYCIDYVGLACVNGTCPKIENYNYSCDECWLFEGCKDCYMFDDCEREDRGYY